MWLTAPNRIGIAAWQSGDSAWMVHAPGGREGIRVSVGDQTFAVTASGEEPLPTLVEQFVRGDELHLAYPEIPGETEFGLRLVIRPADFQLAGDGGASVAFEWLVSVETSRLDSHPTVDLTFPAPSGIREIRPLPDASDRVFLAEGESASAAVLLQRNDAPFTSVIESPGTLRLRLFGEFLEKGVIRRARPWVLCSRHSTVKPGVPFESEVLRQASQALACSPVRLD